MDASKKFEPHRENETKSRKAPVPESRASKREENEEFSLDLSDLGPSVAVEERHETKVLGRALPLSFTEDDLGESPLPETKANDSAAPRRTPNETVSERPIDSDGRLTFSFKNDAPRGGASEARRSEPKTAAPKALASEPKTHFSTSIGKARPKLSSEDEEVPPDDFPFEESSPEPTSRRIFETLRLDLSGLAASTLARARDSLSAIEARRRAPKPAVARRKAPGSSVLARLDPRYRGPLTGALVILVVYGGVTHLLGTAPWSDETPGVPDLGAPFGGAKEAETRAGADAPQRNFRIQGEGKPGEAAPGKSPSAEETAPIGRPPVFQIEGFPEGSSFPGKSLLEVVTSEEELIYVDGVFIGRGPLRRMPLSEGQHAVAIRSGGTERSGQFEAPAGKMVRASFVSLPEEPSAE